MPQERYGCLFNLIDERTREVLRLGDVSDHIPAGLDPKLAILLVDLLCADHTLGILAHIECLFGLRSDSFMLFLDSLHEGIHDNPHICYSEMPMEHCDEVRDKLEELFDVGLEEDLTKLGYNRVKILLDSQTEAVITCSCLQKL